MSREIDLTSARKYLTELAPRAGEILRRYFESGDYMSRRKEGVDFTTQADEEVDTFLTENIRKKYPQTNFLTEETAPDDYSSLKQTGNLWVIDPMDGTGNFSRKHPHFAISIALVDKGISKIGVVYAPIEGSLYWAQVDQEGTFLNGNPIKVSATKDLGEAVIACDWGWDLQKRANVVRWLSNINPHVRQIKSMGSAVADLASLAEGRIDAYMNSGLKPWDVAASALLIEKAGGKITTPQGETWNVFHPDILASNGILHERILNLINKLMLSRGYSLWLMPSGEVYERFTYLIKRLAQEYNGPIFQPHVTLLGEFTQSEEEVIKLTQDLIADQKPFPVTLRQIDYQDFHFRALFVIAEITEPLLSLHSRAKQIFGMQNIPPYMPHLSLLYGNYSNDVKEKIISEIGSEQTAQFDVSIVHLVKGGKVEEWKIVKEFPFQ